MEPMLFVRGDANYHTCSIPSAAWSPGGRLFFAAKPAIDDDITDANAAIQYDWGDNSVTDVTLTVTDPTTGITTTGPYKKYTCTFPPLATKSIVSNGAASLDLLGEFEFVPQNGVPLTSPGVGDKIPVTVYFDIKIKTTE